MDDLSEGGECLMKRVVGEVSEGGLIVVKCDGAGWIRRVVATATEESNSGCHGR